MTDRRFAYVVLLAFLPGILRGQVEEQTGDTKVFSGPQKGERLLPFKVTGVYDDLAGKELDWITEAGDRPIFLVFVHKLTRPSWGLTRLLTRWAAERGKDRAGKEKLATRIIWLDDDRSKAQEYLTRARRSLSPAVPVGISVDGGEGPGSYGLNRNVTLTVLVGAKGKVTANFALVQPSDTEAPKIVAEAAAVIGEKAPTSEELASYGRAYRGDGDGDMRARMRRTDEKLRRLVNRLHPDDLTEEKAGEIIAEIEAYVRGDRAKTRDLGIIARVVSSRRDFASSGTAGARKKIEDWAKKYGSRDARQQPERGERQGDPELVAVLRPIIGKDLTPEEVDRVAARAEKYIAEHRESTGELVRIGRVVLEKEYGTKRAREHFEKWIEKYGKKGADAPERKQGAGPEGSAAELSPLALFEQRIMPIFRSPEPSSCVQCHLAAVDLKDYILPSHEKTFASLRDQGLIDLEHPEKSKVLELIQMGEKDRDRGAQLIHAKTREAEYAAFAAWIEACCKDPALRDLPGPAPANRAGPARPDAVIRHARKSRVVDSFVRNVWSQRMRCFPCHTPHELDETNPKHRVARERVRELERKLGEKVAKRLHIFRETPEATLEYLIEDSRSTPPGRLPLLNLEDPAKSLIVLKPTSKLPQRIEGQDTREKPSYVEPVSHLGGLKMHLDDPSYKSFVAWIGDYARVVGDRYASVGELPADNWYASKHVILLQGAPKDWPELARVQFFVHGWDEEKASWQEEPSAFTQSTVTPRRMVVGALFLLRPPGSGGEHWKPENATLAPGKYLIRAFVDSRSRLAEDPTLLLGEDDFYGETEIRAHWQEGFKQAEKIPGERFEKRRVRF